MIKTLILQLELVTSVTQLGENVISRPESDI